VQNPKETESKVRMAQFLLELYTRWPNTIPKFNSLIAVVRIKPKALKKPWRFYWKTMYLADPRGRWRLLYTSLICQDKN